MHFQSLFLGDWDFVCLLLLINISTGTGDGSLLSQKNTLSTF